MNNLNKKLKWILLFIAILVCSNAVATPRSLQQEPWLDYFVIEPVALPEGVDPQVGALKMLKGGDIAAAFHDGNVLKFNVKNNRWSLYASGLHEPLGIAEDNNGDLVVMQLAELTRLVDENANGSADFYQTVTDDFGLSGNYHEFAFGPVMDAAGNYLIALNVASNYAGIFSKIRGPYNPLCPPRALMQNWQDNENWDQDKTQAGRMFSCVPYRGWILKVTPAGEVEPYASGVRSPDGLLIDSSERLWVTDNQGDWLATSPLLLVEKGDFLGHPASLLWRSGWQKKATEISAEELTRLRRPAAALLPHGELANSPTQPVEITRNNALGLTAGELLMGDMNQPHLIRFLPDAGKKTMQGTLIPFLQSEALGIGNHRMTFDKNGDLWIGKTHLGWAGGEGIVKLKWNKKPYLKVDKVTQVNNEFLIEFNQPVKSQPNVTVAQHTYHYHSDYGSAKVALKQIQDVHVSLDKKRTLLQVGLPALQDGFVYTIELHNVKNAQAQPLMGSVLRYRYLAEN